MSVIEKENFPSESSEQTKEEKKLESSDPVAASSSEELAKFGTPPSSPPREAASVEDEPLVSTTITTVQVVIETELTMDVVESLPDELPTGEKADEEKEETVEEKKEEADEEEGEESDEDEEMEHAPPLFEQPLIVEGKRHRVTAQALQYASPVNTPKYKGGKGSELGNDPHFVEIVGKKTTDELKPLHKLLYGNPGKHATMKRELRRFSGFNFDEQSQEFAKKHKMLVGLKTKELGLIQSAFRKFYWPEDKKDRDAYATELLKLLLSPPDMTASAKTPRGKTSSQTPSRRKRAASGSQEAKTKRVRRSKKIAESEDESEEVSDQEEKEDESMDSGEEKIKEKKEPSSEELSALIGEIIKDADFTTMNTKGIIEQLAAKYPKMNVEKRRPEIKTIIKDTIQQHVPIEDEAE